MKTATASALFESKDIPKLRKRTPRKSKKRDIGTPTKSPATKMPRIAGSPRPNLTATVPYGMGTPHPHMTTDNDFVEREEMNELPPIADMDLEEEADEEDLEEKEEVIFETRAKASKRINYEWCQYGSGMLSLRRSKSTGEKHMVLRKENGKVLLKLEISRGMAFIKVRKGAEAFVRFGAIEEAAMGLEIFNLQVHPEKLEKVYSTLKEMAS